MTATMRRRRRTARSTTAASTALTPGRGQVGPVRRTLQTPPVWKRLFYLVSRVQTSGAGQLASSGTHEEVLSSAPLEF
jgi:hypothetical protein